MEGYGNKVDLSGLDFERIEREFLKVGENQPVAVQSLKDIAKQLLEQLKRKEFKIIHWADKEQTASAVKVAV